MRRCARSTAAGGMPTGSARSTAAHAAAGCAGAAALLVLLGVSSSRSGPRRPPRGRPRCRGHQPAVRRLRDAATAVAAEESLERKYRVEPGLDTRCATPTPAPARRRRWGGRPPSGDEAGPGDRAGRPRPARRLPQRDASGCSRAVDTGDTRACWRSTPTRWTRCSAPWRRPSTTPRPHSTGVALAKLDHLQRLEQLTGRLTPVVFVAGLALLALLASVTRGYRRLLDAERDAGRARLAARRADRAAEPGAARRPARPGAAGRPARRAAPPACCCSTSTVSRRSTTRSATTTATSCCAQVGPRLAARAAGQRHRRPARR